MSDHSGLALTIRDASRATGLSVKALQRRIERGSLEATRVDGLRYIPVSELMRADLLRREPARVETAKAPSAAAQASPQVVAALLKRIAGLEARLATLERALIRSRAADSAQLLATLDPDDATSARARHPTSAL